MDYTEFSISRARITPSYTHCRRVSTPCIIDERPIQEVVVRRSQ